MERPYNSHQVNILCFKSNADKIIRDFHEDAQKNRGVNTKKALIEAAINVIKDDAKCSQFSKTCYPTVSEMAAPDPAVPESLCWLMEGLVPN